MSALLALLLTATPAPSWEGLGLAPSLQRLLERGVYQGTPVGFRAIALSHLADGCVFAAEQNPELQADARRCVEAAFQRGLALHATACPMTKGSARGCDVDELVSTSNALSLAHLLLVMGAADRLGSCVDERLHEGLARGLARLSAREPTGVVPSYRALPLRWPADQSALLAGLHRADVAHGWSTHELPLRRFQEGVTVHRSGLPVSEVTGRGPGASLPRGCAQSFISRYLAEVDPATTAAWWKTYRSTFLVELPFGIVGFREWPPGIDRAADSDSGPIVLGIGVAASALGLSAAKAQGEAGLARRLERSADRVSSLGVGDAVMHATYADAIRFEARWRPVTSAPRTEGRAHRE